MGLGNHKPKINEAPKHEQKPKFRPFIEKIEENNDCPIFDSAPDEVYLSDPLIEWDKELEPEEIFTPSKTIIIAKSTPKAIRPKGEHVFISQSLIKKLINKYQEELEFCPKFIKEIVMDRKIPSVTTESMLKGIFFESLALGGTAYGEPLTDMPRKKLTKKQEAELRFKGLPLLGEKKIDQIRIEHQVERFKIKAKQYMTEIVPGVNTHVRIYKKWDDKYILSGEYDWFPTPIFYEEQMRLAIIDLKFTGDINQQGGSFSWGSPQYMDHLQGDMYHYLVRDIDFELNPHVKDLITPNIADIIKYNEILFLYWVWGIKEPLENQDKIIEREYQEGPNNNFRQAEMKERIRKSIAIIEREEHFGWQTNPCENSCKLCPYNQNYGGSCKESVIFKV